MQTPPRAPSGVSASESSSGVRIAHIGVAVDALGTSAPFFRDVLGMPEVPLADSDGARIAGFAAGDALVELLEADNADSPIGKFVAKRGPGLHHVCFAVDDLDGILERCRAHGVRLVDETPRLGAEGKRVAFLHPSSTGGVLVELTEA
jgi:methylmalonyl-CoA/ethylmalonyl-CoA epimerase